MLDFPWLSETGGDSYRWLLRRGDYRSGLYFWDGIPGLVSSDPFRVTDLYFGPSLSGPELLLRFLKTPSLLRGLTTSPIDYFQKFGLVVGSRLKFKEVDIFLLLWVVTIPHWIVTFTLRDVLWVVPIRELYTPRERTLSITTRPPVPNGV